MKGWLLLLLLTALTWAAPPAGGPELRTCVQNLKKFAHALECYACDHEGRYPRSLEALVPAYLPRSLTCPLSQHSYGYEGSNSGYSLRCRAGRHGLEGPYLSSRLGFSDEVEDRLREMTPAAQRPAADRAECRQNLKRMATALSMWEADHQGKPPRELADLAEKQYLPKIYRCPCRGRAAYTYEKSRNGFRLLCNSRQHRFRYDSQFGLQPQ